MPSLETANSVPAIGEISVQNLEILNKIDRQVGFVPNLFAYYAKNETALADYLALNNRKTTLSKREKEVVNLITSQINECSYCLSTHTAIAKMNGFSDDEIIEIRRGTASFEDKLNALVKLSKAIVLNRAHINQDLKDAFFNVGYSESNLIDVVMLIGDKTMSNYLHTLADFDIDFPLAQKL